MKEFIEFKARILIDKEQYWALRKALDQLSVDPMIASLEYDEVCRYKTEDTDQRNIFPGRKPRASGV